MKVTTPRKLADLFVRLPLGFHLIYGVQDNVFSWERMLEFSAFLENLNIPSPLLAAHISVYAQFICGILFILGWKTKWAALTMIVNFIVAIVLVHTSDPYPVVFPAIMMLSSAIYMFLNGDGYYGLANFLKTRNQNPDNNHNQPV